MRTTLQAKLLFAALAAACCVLFTAISSSSNRPAKTERPVAVNGVLDLTEWDFENSGCARLNGEWEFYWNELLDPQDFRRVDAPVKTGFHKIPGAWNGYGIGNTKLSGNGYGTYRLLVRLKRSDLIYALRAVTMSTAYRLYVDDSVVLSNGRVGTSRETMRPQYLPEISNFRPQETTLQITLQISNFHHRRGGPWNIIELGLDEQIKRGHELRNNFEFFLFGGLLIMAVYHLSLYLFRRKNSSPLFFGIACMIIILRMAVTGEHFLVSLFPDISWELALKLEYITFYLIIPATMAFFEKLFPLEFSNKFLNISLLCGAAFSLFAIVTPASINSNTIPFYQAISVFFCLYLHFVVIRAIINRREGATVLIIGGIFFFITFVNDILISNEFYTSIPMTPFGLFVLMSCQSIVLSKRFSNAFSTVEIQSDRLRINEAELKEKNLALENSNRIKDMFLANTSHELRTPLHGMIGLSESMIEGVTGKLPPETIENLSLIASCGHRLAGMVNDLLDMAKIQEEGITLNLRPVNLYSLSKMVVKLSLPLIGGKPLEIINSIDPLLPAVYADEDRIRQVLHNLIGNAVKFTGKGSIELSSRIINRSEGNDGTANRAMALFTVSDTGIGIPDDYREKIFEAYQQIDGGDTRSYQGTGLGLAIAKQIVELHKGRIWVESWRNRGSAFSFTLPLSAEPVKQDRQDDLYAKTKGVHLQPDDSTRTFGQQNDMVERAFENNPHILVVDDDAVNLKVVRNYFENRQCTIITALDGVSALEIIKENGHIDLVLLDIMMPVLSGYDVCRRIRLNRPPEDLPVIMLTAKNMMSDIDAAFEAGANDYLVKPIRMSELLARTGTMLKLRNIRKSAATGITIPGRAKSYSLAFSEIIYITSHSKNIVIHTEESEIELPLLMKDILDRLPPDLFVRIHKSFVINIGFLRSISHVQSGRYSVQLSDGEDTSLPIGRAFLDVLRKKFHESAPFIPL